MDLELAAISDEPRPGVWIEDFTEIDFGPGGVRAIDTGDGRTLTQHETDQLIALELCEGLVTETARRELAAIANWEIRSAIDLGDARARRQRGGVHSEPVLRLAAFRAWGDRDRAWQPHDTEDALALARARAAWRSSSGLDGDADRNKLKKTGEGLARRGHWGAGEEENP